MPQTITSANICLRRLDEPAVSPGTLPSTSQPYSSRADIAPWDDSGPSPMEQPGDQHRTEFPIHHGSTSTPAINRHPPTSNAPPPWASGRSDGRQMPSSVFGSYFDDSTENLGQVSPGCALPGGMGFTEDGEDRRPSIASATTISSQGSKGSIGNKFQKKLQGFFGEDIANDPSGRYVGYSRQNSETSSLKNAVPGFAQGSSRNRNNSMNDAMLRGSGPPSPGSSRPRTPAPSSEVTPWVFQDPQVSARHQKRLDTEEQKELVTDESSRSRRTTIKDRKTNKATTVARTNPRSEATACTFQSISTTAARTTSRPADLVSHFGQAQAENILETLYDPGRQ